MRCGTTSYTGNATDNRLIGHGIASSDAIKWCIIDRFDSGAIDNHRNDAFVGDQSSGYIGAFNPNRTQAFSGTNIEIGDAANVNALNGDFRLLTCLADAAQIATGSYTGNGGTQSISGIGFQPDVVMLKGDRGGGGLYKTNTMAAGDSVDIAGNPTITTGITSLDATGFTLGASALGNENLTVYRWTAWKNKSGNISTFSYVGDGTDNRLISHGLGGVPVCCIVGAITTNKPIYRQDNVMGDFSMTFDGTGKLTDGIQAMTATQIEVGTRNEVNLSGRTYHAFAFLDDVGITGPRRGSLGLLGVGR